LLVSPFGALYAVTSDQEKATREILRSRTSVSDSKLKTLAGTDPFGVLVSSGTLAVSLHVSLIPSDLKMKLVNLEKETRKIKKVMKTI
ncbi:unnamed protein product, partial [Brassica oleracea var. botrytis]